MPRSSNLPLFLLLSTLLLSALPFAASSIPTQTPVQKTVTDEAINEAIPASQQAQGQVFLMFSHPATRYYLHQLDDGSHLYDLPTSTLITRFWEEISVAELVHNFGDGAADGANCGYDLTIEEGRNSHVFYNQWQLQSLGIVPVDSVNNMFTEWSETQFFHYPPFQNVSDPDLSTSTDRPVYAALNMYRGSGGNPQCGRAGAIFSWDYIGDRVLGAPVDTGFFTGACSQGQSSGSLGNTTMAVCSAWPPPRPLGNPPYLHHFLHPFLFYYNQTEAISGDHYPYYNLARLLIRLLSRETYNPSVSPSAPLPLNFVENLLGYFEINPSMPIVFPKGVKMMVAMFELLWGTEEGEELREWCIASGWPLVWAYNPTMSFFRCGASGDFPGCSVPNNLTVNRDTANARILDPLVLNSVPAGFNITIPEEEREGFEGLWERGWSVEGQSREKIEREWEGFHATFSPSLAIEPLFYGACSSSRCVGVFVGTGVCVCPSPL